MRLIEIVDGLSLETDDDTTIYVARPWSRDAQAMLVSPSPDTIAPIQRGGTVYEYFLETFIAREVLDGLSESAEDRCKRLISYAKDDA